MHRYVLALFLLVASIALSPLPAVAQTPINVNTATAEQLDALPGIGPARAAAIVEARTRRPFRRLTDLLRVSGIGRATLARLAPYVRFDDASQGAPASASTAPR